MKVEKINEEIIEIYSNGKFKRVKQIQDGTYIQLCDRCGGTGIATQYMHYDNGFCYKCMGTGNGKKIKFKLMTEDEIIEDLLKRYKAKCKKKNVLPAPDYIIEKWLDMDKKDIINHLLNLI